MGHIVWVWVNSHFALQSPFYRFGTNHYNSFAEVSTSQIAKNIDVSSPNNFLFDNRPSAR